MSDDITKDITNGMLLEHLQKLGTDMHRLQEDIATLKADVNTLKANMNHLKEDNQRLQRNLDTFHANFDAFREKTDGFKETMKLFRQEFLESRDQNRYFQEKALYRLEAVDMSVAAMREHIGAQQMDLSSIHKRIDFLETYGPMPRPGSGTPPAGH